MHAEKEREREITSSAPMGAPYQEAQCAPAASGSPVLDTPLWVPSPGYRLLELFSLGVLPPQQVAS